MYRLAVALALSVLVNLTGCGKQESGSPTAGGTAGSATVMAQSLAQGLSEMVFRPPQPGERILGGRFRHPESGYAIRPPIGWTRTTAPGSASLPVRDRAVFRDPKTGDFLDVGIMRGGPAAITPASLTALKDDLTRGFRTTRQGKLIASAIFRFRRFAAVQTLVNRQGTILLQLLVFRKPGEFLQIAFGIHQSRYHAISRRVEASIASLEWP